MSATTVIEPYDTQMLDYASDIDVPMHSSNFDTWLHGEALMEDDPQGLHDLRVLPTVEVDMEDYVGESTEYEMADEAGRDEQLDVEVYDVTQTYPTTPILDIDAAYAPPGDVVQHTHTSPSFPSSQPHSDVRGSTLQDDVINTHPAIYNLAVEQPASTHPPLIPQEDVTGEVAVSVLNNTVPSSSDEQPGTDDAAEALPKPPAFSEIPDNLTFHDPSLDDEPAVHTHFEPSSPQPEILQVHSDELGASSINAPHPDLAPSSPLPQVSEVSHSDEPGVSNRDAPDDSEPSGQAEEFQEEAHQAVQGDHEAIVDPHEISEGVYIDPPPAILLSLHTRGDSEICLFNLPHPKSGASSPTVSALQTDELVQTPLLHPWPTLYYEPLNSVFEALRHEEYITAIPALTDGELVFDAYDLQLVISEDNIYAREITLHDLNVLHDGCGLSGPLRLHLQSINPRFISSYHLLRDQIARSTRTAEGGSEEENNANENEQNENQPSARHDGEVRLVDDNEEGSLQQHADYPRAPDGHVANTENQDIGDASQIPTRPDSEEAQDATTQPLSDENENTDARVEPSYEIDAGGGSPAYSAEETDNPDVSADEDVDHVEYTAELAEGNEQFSEALQVFEERPTDYAEAEEAAVEETEEVHVSGESPVPEQYDDEPAYEYDEHFDDNNSELNRADEPNQAEEPEDDENPEYQDDSQTEVPLGHADFDTQDDVDESVLHFVTRPAEIADPPLDTSSPIHHLEETQHSENYDEWDDAVDGEGELDFVEDAEHETGSNESSITLSSKASSKRTYDEVDLEAEPEDGDELSPHSLVPKRPRVQ